MRVLGAGTRTLFRHPGVRPGRPARRAQTCLSYSVLWRDNNSGCKGACDRVAYEDLSVPEKDNQWCVADECYDERLLDRLPDIIREARRHGHRAAPERQPRGRPTTSATRRSSSVSRRSAKRTNWKSARASRLSPPTTTRSCTPTIS
ncbi:hypothetical protein LP419_13690 [Massilia sp. H-1]|nr:hypothetical protein LP419_13690 [Massilia sp. H-1]